MTSEVPTSPILKLPQELRDEIYRYLFEVNTLDPIILTLNTAGQFISSFDPKGLVILRINKKLYSESLLYLFHNRTITIQSSSDAKNGGHAAVQYLRAMPSTRHLIEKLVIRDFRIPPHITKRNEDHGDQRTQLSRTIQLLGHCPDLTSLELELDIFHELRGLTRRRPITKAKFLNYAFWDFAHDIDVDGLNGLPSRRRLVLGVRWRTNSEDVYAGLNHGEMDVKGELERYVTDRLRETLCVKEVRLLGAGE